MKLRYVVTVDIDPSNPNIGDPLFGDYVRQEIEETLNDYASDRRVTVEQVRK